MPRWSALVTASRGRIAEREGIGKCIARRLNAECGGIGECLFRGRSAEMGGWHW